MQSNIKSFVQRHHLVLFFSAWFLLNLVQSYATGLLDDEAYYWIYSQYPAWGYFDHPPVVAMLIKGGYAIFHNEFGVRFFITLMSIGTLYFIYLLTDREQPKIFYAITGSIAVLQLGGILAVPDTPILFFTALFFLVFRYFLEHNNWRSAVLLGLVIACMLYSKYHGILVVVFTLVANPGLFKKYTTYITALVAIVLFIPHIYWQYLHNFPSVQFHLFERNAPHYRVAFTLEYIGGQLVLPGPFTGILLLWAAVRYRTQTVMEKTLRYTLVGVYLLFLVATLKGRAEANWTIVAFISLIVLSYQYLKDHAGLRKWVYRLVPVSLVVILLARIYMMLDANPVPWIAKDEFHKTAQWAQDIKNKAGDAPVIFTDSYQRPSQYWFYTGEPSMSLNTVFYRRNNYNFWPIEETFFNKRALILGKKFFPEPVETPKGEINALWVDHYYSFSRLQMFMGDDIQVQDNTTSPVAITIRSEAAYRQKTIQAPLDTLPVLLAVYQDGKLMASFRTGVRLREIDNDEVNITRAFTVAMPPGTYTCRLAVPSCIPHCPSMNSPEKKLVVE